MMNRYSVSFYVYVRLFCIFFFTVLTSVSGCFWICQKENIRQFLFDGCNTSWVFAVNNICQFLSASTNHTFMILWAIGVLFFIIMEFMTFGLTHIWYAFGCIFAGIAAYNDVSIFLQLVIFIVSSTVLVLLTRPIAEKHVNGKTKKTNIDRLIGQTAIVKETINNKKEQGVVRINGMDWTARAEEIDEVILKGKPVEILDIQGIKLIVRKKK